MNLDTMENIKLSSEVYEEDLEEMYQTFLKSNTRIVKLDIEPVDHVIERCFRIFSYYDRKARYDKQDNKYRLEISYLKFDETEIIKDIFLQFKDRYYVLDAKTRKRVVMEEQPVESFVLREEKNAITNNYISNLYVKRDKFSRPVDQYFAINKAKDGKFYLVNSKNSVLYLLKNGQKTRVPITKDLGAVEIGYKDRIFFSDIDIDIMADPNSEIDDKYKGLVFRYAIFL